jgi:excisionase family DNA binding protein
MNTKVLPFAPRPRAGVLPVNPSGPNDRAVYTVKEVSVLLSISLGGTYTLVREGQIPAIKLGGRWVIPKRRFHAWLEEAAATGGPEEWR